MSLIFTLVTGLALFSPNSTDLQKKVPPPSAQKKLKDFLNKFESPKKISGWYCVMGTQKTPEGEKAYTGVFNIEKRNEVYIVDSLIASSHIKGIAIRSGNKLVISWTVETRQSKNLGVTIFNINSNGSMTGTWASLPGSGVMGTERLVPMSMPEEFKKFGDK